VKTLLIVLLLVAAAVVTGALVAGPQLREALSSLSPEPPATEVRVEQAALDSLTEFVSAPGLIEPHTKVEIAAEVSTRIEELPIREGEVVRKGDIICRLRDRDLKAALESAEARRDGEKYRLRSEQARLEGLRANLEFAQRELERIRALYETGDVSERELDNAAERVRDLNTSIETTKHSISMTETSLAAAEADVDQAQDSLDNTVIASPMDGVITQLNVEVGETVTGSITNPGTVLMTIADLSRMIMNAEVAESDVAEVEIGQQAKLYINAYPDEIFTGTVRQLALQRSINPNGTGYFKTEIEIDLQGRQILSGLMANAEIEIATHEGIVLPSQAIVTRNLDQLPEDLRDHALIDRQRRMANVVYRIVDDMSVCTPVAPGPSDLTHRIIEEGLEEGATVIVGPYKVLESIEHDERVKAATDEASPEETDEDGDEASANESVKQAEAGS
jgi:HlyD family secretion protein